MFLHPRNAPTKCDDFVANGTCAKGVTCEFVHPRPYPDPNGIPFTSLK
jgi:hypothetical protein